MENQLTSKEELELQHEGSAFNRLLQNSEHIPWSSEGQEPFTYMPPSCDDTNIKTPPNE